MLQAIAGTIQVPQRKATQMNIQEGFELAQAYMLANVPVFLHGSPGIGKSDLARMLASAANLPIIDWRASQKESVDLLGIPAPDLATRQTVWLLPSDLPFVGSNHPDECILFLDELTSAPQSIQAPLYQLVLDRKAGPHILKPGVKIIAAGNLATDKAIVSRMSSALSNRFAHIYLEADAQSFRKYAAEKGLHEYVQAFIGFRPNLLHVMPEKGDDTFPTPRMWELVSKFCDLTPSMRMKAVRGLIGEAAATEFEAFCRTYADLPKWTEIEANPELARMPSEVAALFAVAVMCSKRSTVSNFDKVMKYAARLPREFEVMLVVDAVKRNSDLQQTSAFVEWAIRNQDVTL
jgi:hypothetical protein